MTYSKSKFHRLKLLQPIIKVLVCTAILYVHCIPCLLTLLVFVLHSDQKHRGFAFVTYTSAGDAQDAIDNMDLNELRGRVLRVNLARPQKLTAATSGNKAGMSLRLCYFNTFPLPHSFTHSLTNNCFSSLFSV